MVGTLTTAKYLHQLNLSGYITMTRLDIETSRYDKLISQTCAETMQRSSLLESNIQRGLVGDCQQAV